jgi:hypothetical protein
LGIFLPNPPLSDTKNTRYNFPGIFINYLEITTPFKIGFLRITDLPYNIFPHLLNYNKLRINKNIIFVSCNNKYDGFWKEKNLIVCVIKSFSIAAVSIFIERA